MDNCGLWLPFTPIPVQRSESFPTGGHKSVDPHELLSSHPHPDDMAEDSAAVRHNHLRPFLAGRGNKMRRTSLSSHYPSRLSHQASFRHGTIGLQVSLISHTQVFR